MQRLLLLSGPRLAVVCALAAVGCAAATDGGAADGGAASGGATADGASVDGAAVDGGGTADDGAGVDGALSDGAAGDAAGVGWQAPVFELGSNETGKATPKDFVAIGEGGAMEVVKGPQGLWMVVLAFRTCGLYTPPLLLRAQIATEDGTAKGKLDIGKQKLNPSPEGLQYYYNFWLVVDKPELADGKVARVDLRVEDSAGKVGDHTLHVQLKRVCRDGTGAIIACPVG